MTDDDQPDCFSPPSYEEVAAALERIEEEREITGNLCPYCGQWQGLMHRIKNHPEMWIGGSNVYGTPFHGWADH